MFSNSEFEKYILDAREKGLSNDVIRQELQKNGWDVNQINLALSALNTPSSKKKKSTIFILVGLVVLGIIVFSKLVSFVFEDSSEIPAHISTVQITEVTGFPSYLDGRNVVTNGKGTWFAWGSGKTSDDSYFEIKDTVATPIKFDWKVKWPSFGSAEKFSSHPDSAAAYSSRLRTLGTPVFVNDKLNNWYLVFTQNDPSASHIFRIIDGVARPVLSVPNVDVDFKGDGSGNFYVFTAFMSQDNTPETAVFRINGETITEIQGLRNGYDHSFFLNGPGQNYVVLTDGKGTDAGNPYRYATSHVYQIDGDESIKMTQLEGYNRGVSFSLIDGNIYAKAHSSTKASTSPECLQCNIKPNVNDYYKIEGPFATKIDMLPEPLLQKIYAKETNDDRTATFEDGIGNKYEMVTIIGEPFWKCEFFKVENGERHSVIPDLGDIGCADVYTDKKGELIVVVKGDIYGGSKTRVYRVEGKTASYIKDFENMRWLTLHYDSSKDFWYGTTHSEDSTLNKVYKISFGE